MRLEFKTCNGPDKPIVHKGGASLVDGRIVFDGEFAKTAKNLSFFDGKRDVTVADGEAFFMLLPERLDNEYAWVEPGDPEAEALFDEIRRRRGIT